MPSLSFRKYFHSGKKPNPIPQVEKTTTLSQSGAALREQLRIHAPPGPLPRADPVNQDASLLFTKLPPEIRQHVYEAVIGCDTRHIVAWQAGQLLGSIRCSGSFVEEVFQLDNPCWGHFWATQSGRPKPVHDFTPSRDERSKLSFILSCRRIYTEAVKLLYSQTQFVFTGPDIINALLSKVPEQLQQHIAFIEVTAPSIYVINHRTVHTGTDSIDHYRQWTQCVDKLSQMRNLRTLYVVAPNSRPYDSWGHNVDEERTLLQPLCQLKQVKRLVVALAWYNGRDDIRSQEDQEAHRYPFRLHRFNHWEHLPKRILHP